MSKYAKRYIKQFKPVGECTVEVDAIVRDWNDDFIITTWSEKSGIAYKFAIKNKLKISIPESQALEIVDKLGLRHKVSEIFNSGGSYHNEIIEDLK